MKIVRLLSAGWKALLIVLVLGIFREEVVAQQCGNANLQVVYQSKGASASQCAYSLCNSDNAPPQYYLQEKDTSTSYAVLDDTTALFWHEAYSSVITKIYAYSPGGCTATKVSETGSANYEESDWEGGGGSLSASDVGGTWSDPAPGTWSITWDAIADFLSYRMPSVPYDDSHPCSATLRADITIGSISDSGVQAAEKDTESESLSVDATSLARSAAISSIPAFSNPLTTNGPAPFGSASYTLSETSISGNTAVIAACSKMEYFFHIHDCLPYETYLVTWYQYTFNAYSIGPPQAQKMTEIIPSSGDPVAGVNGQVHTVDVPGEPGTTISESAPTITVISAFDPGQ
jgi:hypothetical protein